MNTPRIETELLELLDRGRLLQRELLLSEVHDYHESNSELAHAGMMSKFFEIRTCLLEDLIACQASGKSADRSLGAYTSPFLKEVYRIYIEEAYHYRPECLLSSLLEHKIKPCRERCGTDPEQLNNENCQNIRNAAKWSDEDLIEWIGRYHYMVRDSYDEGQSLVDALFNFVRTAPEPEYDSEEDDKNEDLSLKTYSARSTVIIILSILEELDPMSMKELNVDALVRLLARINGKSKGNYENYIRYWKNRSLTSLPPLLEAIQSDLNALNIGLKLERVTEMHDDSLQRLAVPKEKKKK